MTTSSTGLRARSLMIPALFAAGALVLAGCATEAAEVEPTESDLWVAAGEGETTEPAEQPAEEPAEQPAAADGDRVSVDGMPDVELYGCTELVEHEVKETDFDVQWIWEYECRTDAPYWKTADALVANPDLTQTMDLRENANGYIMSNLHFIGTVSGATTDVDIKAKGHADDLEVTYKVTRSKS
jgi:hypothetical protein